MDPMTMMAMLQQGGGQPPQTQDLGGGDPELIKAILLLIQIMMQAQQGQVPQEGQMPQGMPSMSQQSSPQIQLPQPISMLGKLAGQKGAMYGQLANMFSNVSKPTRSM